MILFGLGLFLGIIGGIFIHAWCSAMSYEAGHRDGYRACWYQMVTSSRVVDFTIDVADRVGVN